MRITLNTDSSVEGTQELEEHVVGVLESALERFRDEVSRVEVHLRDENSDKGGADDKRCMMEARVEKMDPIAVTHRADNVHSAVNGAKDKLRRALDSALGKRDRRR